MTTEQNSKAAATPSSATERLIDLLSPLVEPMGYEIAHLEIIVSKQKLLRLFIDKHPDAVTGDPKNDRIGIEDCTRVSRALNEPLDEMEQITSLFKGAPYDLEVSSPGADRPLRRTRDFERFKGLEARIQTFRALTAEEIQNSEYHSKNPKQKNFLGVLEGVRTTQAGPQAVYVVMMPSPLDGTKPAKTKAAKKQTAKKQEIETTKISPILIPFELIAKAQLEPHFEFGE